MKKDTKLDYITCCPKCDSKGITSLLMDTGKCSNKDCDYIYKSKESKWQILLQKMR